MSKESQANQRSGKQRLLPVFSILLAGFVGAYLVYDNYFSDRSAAQQVLGFEPAAGGNMAPATDAGATVLRR